MRIYFAGFYNLKPEYLKRIEGIEELFVLRSYYYRQDMMQFLKATKKHMDQLQGGDNGISEQGEVAPTSSECDSRGGEGGVFN
jgi:hypothetical protein